MSGHAHIGSSVHRRLHRRADAIRADLAVAARLCFGPGKVVLAERYAATQGSSVRTCAFYSDSLSDLPMLEAAAQPMVVHPDVRLRRLARKRGWRILDWGRP